MNWKKVLIASLTLVSTMSLFTGCGQDQNAAGDSDTSKKIVIGLDDNYPPMGFKDDKNEIVGFDVDLAKETVKRLNREVEFKAIDWSSKEAELSSKRVDILWNGLDITDERKKNMLFSNPYMNNRQIIFVKKGTTGISDEASLAGKIVGTQSASTAEEYFEANESVKNSLSELRTYSDYLTAFMDLENGRVDAIVCDEIVGRYYASKHQEAIDVIDSTVGATSQFGIAFRKDDTALQTEIQKAFDEVVKDGTGEKISNQWFGTNLLLPVANSESNKETQESQPAPDAQPAAAQ